MPLKKAMGNMYEWVDFTHNHLGGECSHKCSYCYVDNPIYGRPERYRGPVRLIDKEFRESYGSMNTVFIENCNDLFAENVPIEFIERIVGHTCRWPESRYVWQTKNPERYLTADVLFPPRSLFGATIETNREIPQGISRAPSPGKRADAMFKISKPKFITIEPVLDFDVGVLLGWIRTIRPEFVNIGADSKGHGLPEPPFEKVERLIDGLEKGKIEVREKRNLWRLRG